MAFKKPKTAKLVIGSSSLGASFFDPDIRWRTGFNAPDVFIVVEIGGKAVIFTNELELERAKKEARVEKVVLISEFLKSRGLEKNTPAHKLISVYLKENGISKIEVSSFFRDILKLSENFSVESVNLVLFGERAIKRKDEIQKISEIGKITELVLKDIFSAISRMGIKNGKIFDSKGIIARKGEFLTSEAVRAFLNIQFIKRGCFCPNAIIASGNQAVDPHNVGSGPLLANSPIIFDIFPRSMANLYWYDWTRTVVKGKLTPQARRMYNAVKSAQEMALGEIKSGVNGRKIYNKVKNFFEKSGYKTGIQPALIGGKNQKTMQGFFHGVGHGVGIDIHEYPRISSADNVLKEGMVVTVEPGLYYYGIGGVRIEDTVVVTQTDHNNLSRFPKEPIEL